MVLCLVTLTDLQTRHAGLSASAELLDLVDVYSCVGAGLRCVLERCCGHDKVAVITWFISSAE